jgi:hypothetical protein
MRGYRIPDDAVDVVPIPMTEWGRLPTYISMEDIDLIVACVVPNSPFHALLKQQQLSILGWNKLDMDRVKVFYPFVEKVNIDVRSLLTQDGSTALAVMDREKLGPLLRITFQMYRVRNSSTSEPFITRLDMSEESIDPTYRCYGDLTIEQKALCESPYDAHGEPKTKPTTWDRPCVKDDDCPFYKANKRYPNSRGGCLRGGVCEMPVGVLRTAFRTYTKNGLFAPFCYGCADSRDPECCSKQKSPDYAFSNDYDMRKRSNVATFVSAL